MGDERYAYGWGVSRTRRATRVVSHNGGNGFFFSDFRRYLDEKVVIIAMSNQAVVPATQLAPRQLESLVFGDAEVAMPPIPVQVSREKLEALAGSYLLTDGRALTVRATAEGLEAEADDPLLLGGFDRMTPPGGRFAELEARSVKILEAASKDDFRPLFEAFNDDRPFEVVQGNQRKFWAGWRADFGEFERLELLGTAIVSGDPAVTVRVRLSKGGPILQLVWGPRRLAGFRIIPRVAPVALIAESSEDWVHYSYRAPAMVRFSFRPAGRLLLETAGAKLAGSRE
jgi:hypothetical protein